MENFAKKLAINHHVKPYSSRKTFPLLKLKKEYHIISKAYQILNESIAKDVPIPPSGEWLLDNYYMLEEQYHFCMNGISLRKYQKLPSASGKARILVLAQEFIHFSDGNVTEEMIKKFLISYQTKRSLSMDEIVLFPLMLKIALLHHIYEIAERIVVEQLEKFKVESLIERLVSQKETSKQQFQKYRKVNLNGEMMTYIEYLIFTLKKLGRDEMIEVLEEEIAKKGTSSAEIIKTLHFDLATRRVSMSNSIQSLKNLSRYNWTMLFEKINPVEQILKEDDIYEKMNYQTKQMYLEEIQKIAKKAHVSEVYVGRILIELGKTERKHMGFYLFREERKTLAQALEMPRLYRKKLDARYILLCFALALYVPAILISFLLFQKHFWIGFLPISEAVLIILTYFLRKAKKPKLLPQMERIPENVETMVIVPSILTSKERVLKLMQEIEVYYLANLDAKLRFCLLGDASESDAQVESFDEEVKEAGINEAKRLNHKYQKELFYFLYRKRVYNPSQEKWLGYERKRGMIEEFNHFLITGNQGTFLVNTIQEIPKIKYIITIDADTHLILGSAKKLIGIMEHPLNEPVLKEGKVISGYGLVEPKITISVEESNRSLFAKLFAGGGGLDMYSGAEFNLYQCLFGETIFTGKGIFRVDLYEQLLFHKIPTNTVLSHDLIEGGILRTGFASNVSFMDGFPARMNAYFFRLKRWTRGDIQNLIFLFRQGIKGVSQYQIWDNFRRILIPVFLFLLVCLEYDKEALIIIFFPFLWEILCIKKRLFKVKRKNFHFHIQSVMASFYRATITLFFLPYKASLMLEATLISFYRMVFSKKHLLEWTTAADSEKMLGKELKDYYKCMKIEIWSILFFLAFQYHNTKEEWIISLFLISLWLVAPFLAYDLSKEKAKRRMQVNQEEQKQMYELANRTWAFFKQYLTEENHFLMPDNYQEFRKRKVTKNTSSTNIGLSLLAVISAWDLGFITKEEMLFYLTNILDTVSKLPKWQGHLYNWYDVTTLSPVEPKFISTVDSGNLVGYLFVVKMVLEELHEIELCEMVQKLIEDTRFSVLYDEEKNLFSIGYDKREEKLVDSYYDLLASEARTASLVAICKQDVPYKHWFYLGRSMTQMDGYQGLLSWSGTMFEYFMPRVIMKPPIDTLLSEANEFCFISQRKYAKKLMIPWGISEAAFNLQDFHLNYQYKAFGIPWLGLKRGLKDEVVVSPYSSILALSEAPKEVLENLKKMKQLGAYGKYGFYESIDFTPSRVKGKYEVVKTYMAHHQALILLSLNNYLNEDILVKRFMKNPEIQSVEVLLEEPIPENTIFTKERKEKARPLKYQDYEEYVEKIIHKEMKNVNILSGENMTMLMNDRGEGYIETDGILISPDSKEDPIASTIYIKDDKSKQYWTNTIRPGKKEAEDSSARFSPAFCEFTRMDEQIRATTKYMISSEDRVVLKKLELFNLRNQEALLDIMSLEKVALCSRDSFIAHPAYQGLFLNAQSFHHNVLIEKRFHQGNKLFYMSFLCDEQGKEEPFEVELDPFKVIGRGRNICQPILLEKENRLSNQIVSSVNPIVTLKKKIAIQPEEKYTLCFYTMIADTKEEMEALYTKYHQFDSAKRLEELAIARAKIENRFLGFKGKEIIKFHDILAEVVNGSTSIEKYESKRKGNRLTQKDLWKFGISGDAPIILFKTSKLGDDFLLDKYLRAIVYFYHKRILMDLVILNGEKSMYEQYNQDKIYELITKENASFLLGQKGRNSCFEREFFNKRRTRFAICM